MKTLFAFAVLLSFAFASCFAVAQEAGSSEAKAPAQPTVQSQPQALPPGISTPKGTVITPASSNPHNRGAHTNYKIFVPQGQNSISAAVPSFTFPETPASIACVYKVGASFTGCNPGAGHTGGGTGGWGAIALVDAYDHPTVASDLATFDSNFGLPAANFTKVIANSSFGTLGGGFGPTVNASCSGTPPNANLFGWDLEIDLDTQWAHAMAPNAQIILVEACSQSLEDLLYAEAVAGMVVTNAGGGDISNSWGCQELICQTAGGQQNADNYFYRYYYDHITYFASAGDAGGEVIYPSSSPWVISTGGTTVNRNSSLGFVSESCWAGSGGGFSSVETWLSPPNILAGMGPWTDYQWRIFGRGNRSTPDMSFNADPNSGVWVYDTDEGGGWYIVGGTSVSSPALAGIVNASNNRLGMTPPGGGYYKPYELDLIYAQLLSNTAYKVNFYDVTTGSNGHAAGVGYDQCTGVGSPRGHLGK